MHPPLDRPHPDCQDEINRLKVCHQSRWQKYTGGCNTLKVALDECFRKEKERFLNELNADLKEKKLVEEEMIKQAFGKTQTFQEYLQQDKDYQRARNGK